MGSKLSEQDAETIREVLGAMRMHQREVEEWYDYRVVGEAVEDVLDGMEISISKLEHLLRDRE